MLLQALTCKDEEPSIVVYQGVYSHLIYELYLSALTAGATAGCRTTPSQNALDYQGVFRALISNDH